MEIKPINKTGASPIAGELSAVDTAKRIDAPVSVDGVSDSSDRVSISPEAQEQLGRSLGNPVSGSGATSPPKEVIPNIELPTEPPPTISLIV